MDTILLVKSLCGVCWMEEVDLKYGCYRFSKHETAEGGNQAIRIKRYSESVFLPARKLGGVSANKGKVTRTFLY